MLHTFAQTKLTPLPIEVKEIEQTTESAGDVVFTWVANEPLMDNTFYSIIFVALTILILWSLYRLMSARKDMLKAHKETQEEKTSKT